MESRTESTAGHGFGVEAADQSEAALLVEPVGDGLRLNLSGAWTIPHIAPLDPKLRGLNAPRGGRVVIDTSKVQALDTGGAWLLHRTRNALAAGGADVTIEGLSPISTSLMEMVAEQDHEREPRPVHPQALIQLLMRIGKSVDGFWKGFVALIAFFGVTVEALGRAIINPKRLRLTPLVHHIEVTGLDAVPIIALINILVGGVIAYQGASQLRALGAEVFTVDLIAIGHLRELGILLTAIMVAGRSGSAFAAEIGAMKVNEEIDAMRTLALDPVEMLVLPRILALVIALPLLAFIADIAGLFGGCLVAWMVLDLSPGMFLSRLTEVTSLTTFWVGIVKAPVFGYLIAMIGCYEGLQVEGSAESVGQHTTQSVVEAIFVVIIVDALFSVFFVQIHW